MEHSANKKLILSFRILFLSALFLGLSACSINQSPQGDVTQYPVISPVEQSAISNTPTISPTHFIEGSPISTQNEIQPPKSTLEALSIPVASSTVMASTSTPLSPGDWMSLPVIPMVDQNAKLIYQKGIELGNNPHAFSKIGDCQSITTYFLSYFDTPRLYNLGEYSALQQTIDWYAGSFSRESLSVKGGYNAAAILSPLRADPKQCNTNENPIQCEFRLNHPSIVIISLEEWWAGHPENYEIYMRQIIEYAITQGVVPIIATKADNLEGTHQINQTIANLAQEYDIPLWNFWAAVQSLPNHGLIALNSSGEKDMFHLTHSEGYYFYNDPSGTQSGWSVRNLTALQVLDAVRRGFLTQP